MDGKESKLVRIILVLTAFAGVLALAMLSGRMQGALPALESGVIAEAPTPTETPEEDFEEYLAVAVQPTAKSMTTRSQPAAAPRRVASAKTTQADRITAIGDSVMLGAANDLSRLISGISIDAAYGRQVEPCLQVLRAKRAAGSLGETVVIHIGNNGTFEASQFDEMMALLKGVPRVIFVTLKVPRVWEEANNHVIADGAARYPGVELIDWHGVSANRSDFFYDDGVHVRPEGAQAYAEMIAGYLETR